jgi:hypothetical protein
VPITRNKALYVVLDTSEPSVAKYPLGIEPLELLSILPVGGGGKLGL